MYLISHLAHLPIVFLIARRILRYLCDSEEVLSLSQAGLKLWQVGDLCLHDSGYSKGSVPKLGAVGALKVPYECDNYQLQLVQINKVTVN